MIRRLSFLRMRSSFKTQGQTLEVVKEMRRVWQWMTGKKVLLTNESKYKTSWFNSTLIKEMYHYILQRHAILSGLHLCGEGFILWQDEQPKRTTTAKWKYLKEWCQTFGLHSTSSFVIFLLLDVFRSLLSNADFLSSVCGPPSALSSALLGCHYEEKGWDCPVFLAVAAPDTQPAWPADRNSK